MSIRTTLAFCLVGLLSNVAIAFAGQASNAAAGGFCTATAERLFNACASEVKDDYNVALARCINVSERDEREECVTEARDTRSEDRELCRDQLAGRREACDLLGEARYDPELEPMDFDSNFRRLTNPNRYFPLGIGNKWEYRSATEIVNVEVLNRTKLIDELRCIVVRDLVSEDGVITEATDDWFAQAKNGNVWYCGEEVKNYEVFDGDRPMNRELVSIDGSFKNGRDGDKAGIIFLGSPSPGDVYREEFSLANAEDIAQVLSTTYSYGRDRELDTLVPAALARKLCSRDCVVTRNVSLLEPGVEERKYYAPGIGVFLETAPATGEVLQLTACNFDARCATLPR